MKTLELFPPLGESTSSAGDSPVSHLVSQDSKRDRTTTVTSGLQCLKLSKESGPLGSLERMLLASSDWASTRCLLTWKKKVTPQGRLLFQLAASMPRIAVKESGLWPTATANEDACGRPGAKMQKMLGNHPEVRGDLTGGTLNPQWVEWLMGFPSGWTELSPSEMPLSRRLSKKSVEQ